MKYNGYVGTYTNEKSEGIYSFDFDGKIISNVKLFSKIENPKYLAFKDNLNVAVADYDNGSGISLFDKKGNELDRLVYEDVTSCYIGVKGNYLYTTNYHEGTFSVVKVEDNKLILVNKTLIKEKAGAHQVLFYKDKYLIPCLFLNKVIIIDKEYKVVGSIDFEEDSGPRHGVFSKDERYLYIVGELSNKLYVVDMELLKVVNTINLLKDKSFVKDSSAIRMSDDNKFIYVSTRTEDVISVVGVDNEKVELLQVFSSRGLHPRDFIIEKGCLIIANRLSNNLVSISLKEGLMNKVESVVKLPEGIAIIMEEIK